MTDQDKKHHDPMEEWNKTMENLLTKEKWNSLTYWQKMCEVAYLQEYWKENKSPLSFLGIL